MRIFVNDTTRRLFYGLAVLLVCGTAAAEAIAAAACPRLCMPLLAVFALLSAGVLCCCWLCFAQQDRILADAVEKVRAYLDGNTAVRIESTREGEVYRLFHEVNNLAAVLDAHAAKEQREKQFLKNTIADISHQLKTPLAALNIYNGLMQDETTEPVQLQQFAALSEQELDRMETLVQNLLKLTRLDAGAVVLEKTDENLAGLLRHTAQRFACRAGQEQKQLLLSGDDTLQLQCDRSWLEEAVGNLLKNALDHTAAGDSVWLGWDRFAGFVRVTVRDNGAGIHPEDLPHLFKRFYRSRFAQQTQGIGLGLPLTKAIVEAHGGSIEVESRLGHGACFTLLFRNATKL